MLIFKHGISPGWVAVYYYQIKYRTSVILYCCNFIYRNGLSCYAAYILSFYAPKNVCKNRERYNYIILCHKCQQYTHHYNLILQTYRVMILKGQILSYLGLLNGMIGGTILVLPLLGIETGYILIPCISILYGFMSYYTCRLIIQHLGQCRSLRDVILQHFNNRFSAIVIYNIIIVMSFLGVLMNYFQLIIKQVQGFVEPNQWISIVTLILLVVLTIIMRYFNFSQKLLAIGILSIVSYLCFLIWAYFTAQYHPKGLPAVGPKFVDLAAALTMGYSTQNFIIQILYKTTTNDKFQSIIRSVYISGIIIYTFICFAGYTIINKQPRVPHPDTISQYFAFNSWQVRAIEIIYLFHLITVSPQFCIILRTRLLQIFGINPDSQPVQNQQEDNLNRNSKFKSITIPQVIVYISVFSICYLVYRLHVKISTIIELNGSIIGFLYIFLTPALIHIKCVYFSKHDQNGYLMAEKREPDGTVTVLASKCRCRISYSSWFTKVLQLLWIVFMLVLALFTVYFTLRLMFWANQTETKARQHHFQL